VQIAGKAPEGAYRLGIALGRHGHHMRFRADINAGGIRVHGREAFGGMPDFGFGPFHGDLL